MRHTRTLVTRAVAFLREWWGSGREPVESGPREQYATLEDLLTAARPGRRT
jgi:hypothetical protein